MIAPALYPSEVLKFAAEGAAGIVLTSGGATSHVAILARTLGIPLIIAGRTELLAIPQDTPVLMDAELGNVYVNPDRDIVERFKVATTRRAGRRPRIPRPCFPRPVPATA